MRSRVRDYVMLTDEEHMIVLNTLKSVEKTE
jgi:hypothetical protein